ncbi:BGTF surface domain-containing protein [Halogeometricum luteum]|uniref:PGF-CTERM sorting domain-containing protein n=1 Tax=Halogeometricum luteum TaxID=2950537 RepID=A0ABU2G4Z3_9EURY|nr:BGTF surface domain-containing protein [Halogeometricum sp. S3BR5-2]MDS0295369.1 PGF-CTERM sorting domain-containing protein [Halogeometricum sp. S3BR5-2]
MSETNNLRALLMAALVAMSVFAGVGTVSAFDADSIETGPEANVAVGQDTATQEFTFETSIAEGETETITIDTSSLPNDAELLGVGATAASDDLEIVESSVDDEEATIGIENTGDAAVTGSTITVTLVYDTSDLEPGDTGPASFNMSNSTSETDTEVTFDLGVNEIGDVNFQGEVVHINTSTLGDDVTLREVDEREDGDITQSSFISQLNPTDDGIVEIDTNDLEGDYVVAGDGGVNGENAIEFEVAVQSLTANWSEDSVNQDDEEDLELESGRSDYLVEVGADGLDADDLEDIFGEASQFVGVNDEDDTVYLESDTDTDITANFSDDIDAGDYNFDVEVTDTTASDSASIEVTDDEADVNFADSVYTEQVGDVVEMSVNMEDREEAYVFVGGEDVNYLEAVQLTDDDEDGVVNFTFNSYTANEENTNPFELVEDSDDELELATGDIEAENGDIGDSLDGTLDERLETGDYDLRTSTSLAYDVDDDEVVDEQDVATLDLGERSTNGINTWTAPSGNAGEYDDVEELLEEVNRSSTLAIDDRLVVQINASGISGIVDEDDITTINGQADNGLNLDIEEGDSGANADDNSGLTLDSSNAEIYQDQSVADNQVFVVVDTRNVDLEDEEQYEAVFTVGDEDADVSPIDYVDDEEEESVSTTFIAEDANADLDLNDDDQFEVPQSQNAQVEFDTNLAGGSEVIVRLRSSASDSAFLLSNTVDTDANGTVSTTFDTSDIEVGTEFNMVVRSDGDEIADEDGIIVEGSNMTGTMGEGTMSETPGTDDGMTDTETEMPTDTEETPTEGGESPTEGGETTTGSTDGGTPGFGVVVAVTALLAAALLAVRRD